MILKNRGIAFKLSLFILASCTLIFFIVFGYDHFISKKILLQNVEQNATHLAEATVNKIEIVLRSVEKSPNNIRHFMENSICTEEGLLNLLKSIVKSNQEIYGSTIAFEPYMFHAKSVQYAPYFFKNNGEIDFTYLGGEDYPYHYLDWYLIPKVLDKSVWSEPYYDEGGGNILMSTYSVPFYTPIQEKHLFRGIVTADISLEWLQELVSSIRIYKSGYGFVISKNGTFVIHPNKDLIMNETIFSLAESTDDNYQRELGRKMIHGGSDFIPITDILSGKKSWIFYTPLSSSGWSLGVVYPENELMADINQLNRILFILTVIGFGLLLIVIITISSSITKPLRALAKSTTKISTGNLDTALPSIKFKDEVGKLTESFGQMQSALKEYIQHLKETTAAKEKIESELKIAHDIQMEILPKIFPPFPDRSEFKIDAQLIPAKEVGGDFFDFFFIDDAHLCITIGDVSGKGVPASLLMAVTTTLIKAKSAPGMSPAEIMGKVNIDVCEGSNASMFVTAFLGILNIQTGKLVCSNAGHNIPFIFHQNGHVKFMENTTSLVLGAFKDFRYQTITTHLLPDEGIFLYTDGVTEAMDPKDQLYSDERLEKFLSTISTQTPEEVTKRVIHDVQNFSAGAPQSDDITIVTLRYKGIGG